MGRGFTHLFFRLLGCYSRLSRGYILAYRIYNLCAGLVAFASSHKIFQLYTHDIKILRRFIKKN